MLGVVGDVLGVVGDVLGGCWGWLGSAQPRLLATPPPTHPRHSSVPKLHVNSLETYKKETLNPFESVKNFLPLY